MVTSSLATPACQYGNLLFRDDGSFRYWTQSVDVERWAKRHNRAEKDLLEFDDFKEPFLRRVFYNQSYDALAPIGELNEKQKEQMSELYSEDGISDSGSGFEGSGLSAMAGGWSLYDTDRLCSVHCQ